jgi:twitching motility protein PilT
MAFFRGNKQTTLQRVKQSDWKTPAERQALLSELSEQQLRPDEFIFLISHSDPACRQLGAAFVKRTPGPVVLEKLIEEAEGKQEAVRKGMLRLVMGAPQREVTALIEKLVSEKAPAQRQRIGWQLAFELPRELKDRFIELGLRSKNPAVRAAAVQRLLEDTPPGTEPSPLVLELARGDDEAVRSKVLAHLEQHSSDSVFELMLDRLVNDTAQNRERALVYLIREARASPGALRERMIALLASSSEQARRGAVEVLLSSMPPKEALLQILDHSRGLLGWLRSRIIDTLRGFEQVLQPLGELLAHPDEEIRVQALVLAQTVDDRRLVQPIARLLRDPDWWIRVMAADCLGRSKDERCIDALKGALSDPDTKWAAIEALARIGSPRAFAAIAEQLRDPKVEVRLEAVSALASLRDPHLVAMLQRTTETDPSQVVRTRAAEILRANGVPTERGTPFGELQTAARNSADIHLPFDRLLAYAREAGASDIHISVGEPPWVRVAGTVERLPGYDPITADQARDWLVPLLDARQLEMFEKNGEVDLCHKIEEVGRFRASLFNDRHGLSGSFRVIPNLPPSLSELRVPDGLNELLYHHQGLIVVSGPTGCGKSTTLAAFVNLINETKPVHVISLEDPVEFVHPSKTALVEQREIGRHTDSFERGLRASLREDPDVIIVGEIRDSDTTRLALTAAETGHLVFATLHTTSAVQTVDRLIDAFPPSEQPQVRMALSESLQCVISQSLVPCADGRSRAAAFEVLKCTLSVSNLIREGKTYQLPNLMQIGQNVGMRTVDQSLRELLDVGLITAETALARAENKQLFEEEATTAVPA